MRHLVPSALILPLLAGCTVGPNYGGPPAAASSAAKAPGFVRANEAPITSAAPTSHWWEGLQDPILDQLIAKALTDNPDVLIARAKLRQARAALGLRRADGTPQINASAVYAHAHIPGADLDGDTNGDDGGSSDLNLYNLGFDASWEVDLFGGQRRAIEAERANVQSAEADAADVAVSISAEVAQAYVNLRERQQRIALSQQALAMQQQMLDLTRQRYSRGTASEIDVSRIEGGVSGSRAQLTPLSAERDAYLNALAVLTGQEPGQLDALLASEKAVPLPPEAVAVGDPTRLLQQRPDIRAAERRLAADTAKIGQAEAARFPRLSFMGLIGIGGTRLSDLGHLDDFAAIAAPRLSWSFLDFGRNRARVGQAEAVRDEAEARYRSTVLGALRDAEDSLARFRDRRITVASLARTLNLADRRVELMAERNRAGTVTRTDLLDSQRQEIAARQDLISAQAALTQDFVAIQKALGLGWSPPAKT